MLGSSIDCSGSMSGKADQSAGLSVLSLNEEWAQVMESIRSPPSKVTATSSSVFTMLVRTLPETTVSPLSSTFAGMR